MHRDTLLTALPDRPPQPASRYPHDVLAMSAEELREEWLRQERALTESDRLIDAVVDAVWPPSECTTERPDWWDDHAEASVREQSNAIVAGIASVHELNDRLMQENERLRARVAELEKAARS
jgi:hypothetical protein